MTAHDDDAFLDIAHPLTIDIAMDAFRRANDAVMADCDAGDNSPAALMRHARMVQLYEITRALHDGNLTLAHEHATTLAALTPAEEETP